MLLTGLLDSFFTLKLLTFYWTHLPPVNSRKILPPSLLLAGLKIIDIYNGRFFYQLVHWLGPWQPTCLRSWVRTSVLVQLFEFLKEQLLPVGSFLFKTVKNRRFSVKNRWRSSGSRSGYLIFLSMLWTMVTYQKTVSFIFWDQWAWILRTFLISAGGLFLLPITTPTQQPVNCGTRFTSNFVQKHHLYDRGKGPKKSRTRKHVAIMGAVLTTDKSALLCPKLIHFRKQGSIVSNLIF